MPYKKYEISHRKNAKQQHKCCSILQYLEILKKGRRDSMIETLQGELLYVWYYSGQDMREDWLAAFMMSSVYSIHSL